MATADEDDVTEKPEGIVAQIGGVTYKVVGETTQTVYGARSGSLWPVVLIVATAIALVAAGLPGGLWDIVALSSLALLAVWVGARG